MGKVEFAKIFEESFNEYLKKFKSLLPLSLLIYFIPYMVFSVFANLVDPENNIVDIGVWPMIIVFALLILLLGLFNLLWFISLITTFSGKVKTENILKKASGKFLIALGGGIVLSIITLILFLLLIIPGIIFSIYFMFMMWAIVIDNKGIFEALKYSMSLVRGRWWQTLGYNILLTLISLVVSIFIAMVAIIISVPLAFVAPDAITGILIAVVQGLGVVITTPFFMCFYTKWYKALKAK